MGDTLGKYQLLAPLSIGGMAELHLACVPGPGGFRKFVALKQILPDVRRDERFVRMFLDEARLTAGLSHPNIGQVFDLGEEGDELYLAMEFIAGSDLERVITRYQRLGSRPPLEFTCRVVADAARALHCAHSYSDPVTGQPMPIVHRDVAPKNLMLTFDGVVKVIDFGIATARGRLVRTQVGQVKGTVPYMSPEQLTGKPLDGRSDLYSLGVVLWELLAGEWMRDGSDADRMMKAIVHEDAPPLPGDVVIPQALRELLTSLLHRDPEWRPASGREVARALEHVGVRPADEEQLGSVLSQLFPQTKLALRSMLASAQRDDVDEAELRSQVKALRKADATPAPTPAAVRGSDEAQAAEPFAPTHTTTPAANSSRSAALLAVGAVVLALVGWGVVRTATEVDAAPEAPPVVQEDDPQRAEAIIARAEALLATGDIAGAWFVVDGCRVRGQPCPGTEAITARVARLKQNPCADGSLTAALVDRAQALLEKEDIGGAWRTVEACFEDGTSDPRLLALQAAVTLEEHYGADIEEATQVALSHHPDKKAFQRASERLEAAAPTRYQKARREAALAALTAKRDERFEATGLAPPESQFIQSARMLEARGAVEMSVMALQRCIATHPDSAGCHKALGESLARSGQAGAAYGAFKRYLELASPADRDRRRIGQLVVAYEVANGIRTDGKAAKP